MTMKLRVKSNRLLTHGFASLHEICVKCGYILSRFLSFLASHASLKTSHTEFYGGWRSSVISESKHRSRAKDM